MNIHKISILIVIIFLFSSVILAAKNSKKQNMDIPVSSPLGGEEMQEVSSKIFNRIIKGYYGSELRVSLLLNVCGEKELASTINPKLEPMLRLLADILIEISGKGIEEKIFTSIIICVMREIAGYKRGYEAGLVTLIVAGEWKKEPLCKWAIIESNKILKEQTIRSKLNVENQF